MQYTEAPWSVDESGALEDREGIESTCIWGATGAGHGRVAEVYSEYGRDDMKGNAALIAAAPDLFQALTSLARNKRILHSLPTPLLAEIRYALEKATGYKKGELTDA